MSWTLPVETIFNGDTGEDDYVITLPDDLLKQSGWKCGDYLQWIDRGDGSFELKKFEPPAPSAQHQPSPSAESPSKDSFPSR
jgi:hypothetical protein